jgi:hypothetical protein
VKKKAKLLVKKFGEEKGKIDIIKKMLLKNKDIEEIIEITDFTKEEILKIKNDNNL